MSSRIAWDIHRARGLRHPRGRRRATGPGHRRPGKDDEITRAVDALPAPAANVARLYRALAQDLRQGTTTVPDFAHALRQHRLVEAIREANRSGQRQHPS
jgi:predicted dehydrogenase